MSRGVDRDRHRPAVVPSAKIEQTFGHNLPVRGGLGPAVVANLPPGIDTSVGDWRCPACGNWNWARRKQCNQCNAAKDGLCEVKGTNSGTKRLGEGGGFKE